MGFLSAVAQSAGLKYAGEGMKLDQQVFQTPYGGQHTPVGLNDSDTDYLRTYATVPWVYSAVWQLQVNFAGLKFHVFRKTGDNEAEDVTNDDMFQMIQRPNPWSTKFHFWMHNIGALELNGKVFWWLPRNSQNQIMGIIPLRSDKMSIVPGDTTQFIKQYVYNVNGKEEVFDPEEIFYMRYWHPTDDFDGLSSVQAASNSIVLQLKGAAYNKKMFDNQIRPSGVWSSEQVLDDAIYKRAKKQFMDTYSGAYNAGNPIFIDGGYKYTSVEMKPKDIEYIKGNQITKGEILSTLGVPPILVQEYSDASVLANADVQMRSFWHNTMLPKISMILEVINEDFLPMILGDQAGDYYVDVDLSTIDALKEQEELKISKYKTGWDMAAVKPNDYREHVLGLERIDDPMMEQTYMKMNLIPIGEDQQAVAQGRNIDGRNGAAPEQPDDFNVEKWWQGIKGIDVAGGRKVDSNFVGLYTQPKTIRAFQGITGNGAK